MKLNGVWTGTGPDVSLDHVRGGGGGARKKIFENPKKIPS